MLLGFLIASLEIMTFLDTSTTSMTLCTSASGTWRQFMALSPALKIRIYLHLVPVLGVIPSLWTLYGNHAGNHARNHTGNHDRNTSADTSGKASVETVSNGVAVSDAWEEFVADKQVRAASRLSIVMGVGCVGALALLGAGASSQASQLAHLRFLIASSFVGSGYFTLSLVLMLRIAKNQSIRLPGISQLSDRLPNRLR